MNNSTMTQNQKLTLWLTGIVIIGFIVWGVASTASPTTVVIDDNPTASSTNNTRPQGGSNSGRGSSPLVNSPTGTPAKVETYNNATHNFTISYPIDLTAGAYSTFHLINQNDWRIGATAAKRGTPVIAVPVFRVDNEASNKNNYPRYYAAEVRVGVSLDTTQCYAKDEAYANQTVSDVTINGVTFKKFTFGDAATMQYLSGASYRTIHNNKCYVIEQIRNGSSYRDGNLMGGYSDQDLDAFYARTTPIVMSFKFTK